MSAIACEIIGTGDGELKNCGKNVKTESKTIAKDIVFEIIANALEIVDDASDVTIQKIMEQSPIKDYKEKRSLESASKEKSAAPLIGTGDQKSNENIETQEPVPYHPPVEKKNRLTDLVKNSKQILARIMMSESKMALQEEKKADEHVLNVIELDCVEIPNLSFKTTIKISPEEVPLPQNDSQEILASPSSEAFMDEIGLTPEKEETVVASEKRGLTFPRAGGSRARAAFAAKCRTLKREATNLRKKKWDVGEKIVSFFRKKRENKEEGCVRPKSSPKQEDLDNTMGFDK